MITTLLALTLLTSQADSLVVSAQWLAEHRNDPNILVLGIGMRETEFAEAHIPGAQWLDEGPIHAHGGGLPPLADVVRELERAGVTDRSQIVLFGTRAKGMWPGIAFVVFDYLGLGDRTRVLDGGLMGWQADGFPVASGTTTVAPGKFTPHIQSDIVVNAAWVEEHLNRPDVLFLDARSAEEYTGARHISGILDGHLPGARHLEWTESFDAKGWKSLPDLIAGFQMVGANTEKVVVTYCQVGMRASHLYLAARRAGLRPKIYLGSMQDWSRNTDRPVTTSRAP